MQGLAAAAMGAVGSAEMTSKVTMQRVSFIARSRQCPKCGGAAKCVLSSGDQYDHIPGGTEYRFECACGERFTIQGYGRIVFSAICSPLLCSLAVWAALTKSYRPSELVFPALMFIAGVGMAVQQLMGLRLRLRARELPPSAGET